MRKQPTNTEKQRERKRNYMRDYMRRYRKDHPDKTIEWRIASARRLLEREGGE